MKFLPSFAASLLFVGSSTVFGQMPPASPQPHSITLTAESAGAGGGFAEHRSSNLQGNVLSDRQVQHSGESVNLTVRNFGPQADNVRVEWYFVADPIKKHGATGEDYIFDKGSKDVSLAAGATQQFTADSKEIATTEKKTEALHGGGKHHQNFGQTKEGGSKVRGWFVRVMADGKVIDAKGSSQEYEDTAKDDAKLKALASR